MGKIVASYLVKVHLHEPDDLEKGTELEAPFTNDQLEGLVKAGIAEKLGELTVTASVERVDE